MKTRERKRQRRPAEKQELQLVYTQPKVFNRNRFLLRLATVLAIVLALLFAMSIFFRVETVNVSGVEKYTEYDVYEASGISQGEYLLTLSKSQISSKILQQLPYVNTVRIGISLPGTVNIEVEELAVCYAVQAQDDAWWLIDSRGKVLEQVPAAQASTHTKLKGFVLAHPEVAQQAVALEPEPEGTLPDGETVPVTVTARERLDTAITVLQLMEQKGILGQAASVDVTKLTDVQIWYGDQYHILLGDGNSLPYKMQLVKGAIDQMGAYRNGTLDVSFTIRPDEVVYTPFE